MNLHNLSGLWWLLPLGAVIVALYLLRMRRRDVQVPAVFLWPERTEEVRANTLFQKLRFSWLLVLQLLALTTIVFAFARPQLRHKGLSGKVTVVVIDASASMGATDLAPTRLEWAKKQVSEMVNTATVGDRLALIEAGPLPRVVFPLSRDSVKQLEGLSSVKQYDSESDVGEAMRLAAALAGQTDGAKIVVLSDGVFEPILNFAPGKASVFYQQVGKSGENSGIQALGTSETPNGTLAYCGVKNFGTGPTRTTVSVYANGNVVDSVEATIGPGQTWGKTVPLPPQTKIVEARLGGKDALKADDYAVSLIDPGASARVLLVTKGDIFLERALALDPRVVLDKSDRLPNAERAGSIGEGAYDLVVFESVPEVAVKARGVLTLGSAGPATPVKVNGEGKAPEFVSSVDSDVMSGVDFETVYIERFQRVAASGSGQVVAEAKQGPLVVVSSGLKRQVYLAFSPLESDFPLNVSFPIFIGNVLDFLIGKETSDQLAVRVGQPFVVSSANVKEALLQPEGREHSKVPARDDRVTVREIDRVGKYRLTVGDRTKTVYAMLRSPTESACAPRASLEMGSAKVAAVTNPSRFEDFWQPILLAAMLVLGVEWFVYAKRS